jgi:hypothetical protein
MHRTTDTSNDLFAALDNIIPLKLSIAEVVRYHTIATRYDNDNDCLLKPILPQRSFYHSQIFNISYLICYVYRLPFIRDVYDPNMMKAVARIITHDQRQSGNGVVSSCLDMGIERGLSASPKGLFSCPNNELIIITFYTTNNNYTIFAHIL